MRQWATVMAMAGATSRPPALISLALLRARLCQKVAAQRGGLPQDRAFTAGLFSVLDALLEVPMDQAVARLPLGDDVKAALVARAGVFGAVLAEVIAIEAGDLGVLAGIGADAYALASRWADEATAGVA